jgi:hypothetical protein
MLVFEFLGISQKDEFVNFMNSQHVREFSVMEIDQYLKKPLCIYYLRIYTDIVLFGNYLMTFISHVRNVVHALLYDLFCNAYFLDIFMHYDRIYV